MKPAIHMCINGKVKVRQSCSLILYINERLRYINPVHVITKTGNSFRGGVHVIVNFECSFSKFSL